MKKLIVLVVLLALVPVLLPAKADALTLRQRVTRLEGKLNCLRRIPVSEFGDMAAYGHPLSGPNTMSVFATVADPAVTGAVDNPDSLTDEGPLPALDWDFGETGPHYFLLAIRANSENVPYPGCAAKFALQPTPVWWGRATSTQRMTRTRQLARAQ
jgi:hypothetical protein